MPTLNLDMRLIEASIELEMLDKYLTLTEDHISQSVRNADAERRTRSRDLDEADWHLLSQNLDWQVSFVLARVLRNSFLAILFAVYETIVTEVAGQVQQKKGISTSLNEINNRRSFVDRAKTYYKDELEFDLWTCNERWKRVRLLSYLRNAIVHRNGRIDMVESRKEEILEADGVNDMHGFIAVSEFFLRETFQLVKAELDDLIIRYKDWDTQQRTQGHH